MLKVRLCHHFYDYMRKLKENILIYPIIKEDEKNNKNILLQLRKTHILKLLCLEQ
jgi:hypothetical protein